MKIADSDIFRYMKSIFRGFFGLIIYNEAYFLKNIDFFIHRSIDFLNVNDKLFFINTLIINYSIDLVNLLELL